MKFLAKRRNQVLLFLGCAFCFVVIAIVIIAVLIFSQPVSGPTGSTTPLEDPQLTVNEYLGYEETEVYIMDNLDLSGTIEQFHGNMAYLAELESDLQQAASSADADSFFTAYEQYNSTASEMISMSQSMYEYTGEQSDESDAVGDFLRSFAQPVRARERFSYWYYVPIIGSLVKAKHQSIETSRAGIYDYLKNELDAVDRNQFLQDYNLQSVEDLRTAGDGQIEQLARDPELRAGIDWTKVATDLAEHAAQAVTDSYKIGPSRSPAGSTLFNGAVRLFTKPGTATGDELPSGAATSTSVILVSDSTATQINDIAGDYSGTPWGDIPVSDQQKITTAIKSSTQDNGDAMVVTSAVESDPSKLYIPEGDWQLVAGGGDTAPVQATVTVTADQQTDITVPAIITDDDMYVLDPQIAASLGFDVTMDVAEIEISSCLDLGVTSSSNSCDDSYASCMEQPYTSLDGYTACVGSNGGCWDIGRWEYVDQYNCPIDNDLSLDYSDVRLQPDYEYFGNGNRAYCECIVSCREEFWVEKDCSGELSSCCNSLAE